MRTQLERPRVDLDDEREVDLRSAWQRITTRWWLPIGGLVLGLVAGVLLALGGGQVWKAGDAARTRPAVLAERGCTRVGVPDEPPCRHGVHPL
jgi:hypothetical protein